MSKVKNFPDELKKSKLMKVLRRYETRTKKDERRQNAKRNVYRSLKGYYIPKEKYIGKYEYVTVPERKETYDSLIGFRKGKMWDAEEMALVPIDIPVFHKKTIIVPEHIEKRHIRKYETIPSKEIPKRISASTKQARKRAQRKLRRTHIERIFQRGDYKKIKEVTFLWM